MRDRLPSTVSRRGVLKALGVGMAVAGGAGVATAQSGQSVFADGTAPREAVRDNGGTVTHDYDNFDFIVGRVPDVDALRKDGRVSKVEPDGTAEASHHREGHDGGPGGGGGDGGDDDGSQGSSETTPWGVDRIDAEQVTGLDGAGVDVAILDTGIDVSHPDLDVTGGVNYAGGGGYDDKDGHGTHCAGIAAALDNSQGVVGVAPGANLYAVKVLGNNGSGSFSDIVAGIDWCMTNEREVLSMSFGASSMPDSVGTALSEAAAAGHVLVAATGNRGNDGDGDCEENNVDQPARHPDVVAVSAMTGDADGANGDDVVASYSSVGSEVDLMAPGTDIYSTYKGDSYETLSGTSMACPHVSGLAALVWEAKGLGAPSSGDSDTVRTALENTESISDIGCEQGAGLVDAEAATSSE